MNKETVYIYGLLAEDGKTVVYVGKANDVRKRISSHCGESRNGWLPKDKWIRSLLESGKNLEFVIIEECSELNWQARERYWIGYYRRLNRSLLNVDDGGGAGRPNGTKTKPFTAGPKRKVVWFALPMPDAPLPLPATASADITLGYCPKCGATWHEPYTVVWWAAKAPEDDVEWPILHEQQVQGQGEQHKPGCPAERRE